MTEYQLSAKPASRRTLLKALGAVSGAAFLSACAAPTPTTPTQAPTSPPKPAPTTAPATATAAPAAAKPAGTTAPAATAVPAAKPAAAGTMKKLNGQIVIANWHIGSGQPSQLAQQKLTDAYHKFQPDVDLVWEVQVGGDYITWLGTQLAAGTPRPDIVSVNLQPSYNKYIDFISYKDSVNPYTGNKWSQDFDFEFYGSGSTKWTFFATQQVQVPWFYNQDLFDKAGVSVPTTFDDWMDTSDKILTKTGIAPMAMHYNNLIQWLAEVSFDQYHRDWVDKTRAQPGDWNYNPKVDDVFKYDPTDPNLNKKATFSMQRLLKGLKDGTLRYDDAEMADLMKNWKRLAPYQVKDFWVGANRYAAFIQGQAAMFPDLTTSYWTLSKDLSQMDESRRDALKLDPSAKVESFKYAVFQYPSYTGPLVKGKARAIESIAGEYLGGIDKNAQQTELVVDFMQFWMSKAGYQPWVDGFAEADLWTPSGKLLISSVNVPDKYTRVLDSIKPVGNAEAAPNGFLTMFGGYGKLWQTESQNMVKGILDGTLAPEDFGPQYHALITDKYWSDVLKAVNLTEDDVKNPQLQPKQS